MKVSFKYLFQVAVCSSVEELHQDIDRSELTADLDGIMPYSHSHWIQQRIVSIAPHVLTFCLLSLSLLD